MWNPMMEVLYFTCRLVAASNSGRNRLGKWCVFIEEQLGWQMVPEVHELPLQDVVVVLLHHGTVELHVFSA